MNNYKNILISIVTSLITVILIYGGYTIYAEGENPFESKPLFEAFNIQNGDMNSYFNEKIEKLNLMMEKDNFYNDERIKELLLPPKNIDTNKDSLETVLEKCGTDNVSSYCVSMGALYKHMLYVQQLTNLKGSLDVEALAYVPILNALSSNATRNVQIDEEIAKSEEVMKATVAAYTEYKLAYPMHKKYEEIIENLVKYKLSLKDIRKRTMQFPIKFIDATSSQCE